MPKLYQAGTVLDARGRKTPLIRQIPKGKYIPGGPNPNTRGTYVRNWMIGDNMNGQYNKWFNQKFSKEAA